MQTRDVALGDQPEDPRGGPPGFGVECMGKGGAERTEGMADPRLGLHVQAWGWAPWRTV